jgi:hypothetical protein
MHAMNLELLEKHFKEGKYDEARQMMEAFFGAAFIRKGEGGWYGGNIVFVHEAY